MICANCNASAPEPTHETKRGGWSGMPHGWLVWRDWCGSELFGERVVCSAACADKLEAKEQTEAEIAAAGYARRKAAGELTDWEKLDEQMAATYAQMMVDRARDMEFFLDKEWEIDPDAKLKPGQLAALRPKNTPTPSSSSSPAASGPHSPEAAPASGAPSSPASRRG